MTRPIRDKDPTAYRLITIRTEEARLWITPNHDTRRMIGGVVARYQEIFEIEMYAFIFLSNHPHMIVRAPKGNVDEFCENVNREIARRINWKNRRIGKFWARRYDDQKILSEDDLLTAFLYVTNNAVRHGLVEHPSLWPGLNSYKQSTTETSERFSFHHYSATNAAKKVTQHRLKISPLPQFARMKREDRVAVVSKLIDDSAKEYVKARKDAGLGFLGLTAIRQQSPQDLPLNVARRPRPVGYSKYGELCKDYRRAQVLRRRAYVIASRRFRLGDMKVTFPPNSFKPTLHRKPRIVPFQPLPEDAFKNVA
jgi:putative transposase